MNCPGHSWTARRKAGVRVGEWYCEVCGRVIVHPEKIKILDYLASQIEIRGDRYSSSPQEALERIRLNLSKKSSVSGGDLLKNIKHPMRDKCLDYIRRAKHESEKFKKAVKWWLPWWLPWSNTTSGFLWGGESNLCDKRQGIASFTSWLSSLLVGRGSVFSLPISLGSPIHNSSLVGKRAWPLCSPFHDHGWFTLIVSWNICDNRDWSPVAETSGLKSSSTWSLPTG